MKKRILMLTLVLMIVLSSFSIVFADALTPYYILEPGTYNLSFPNNSSFGLSMRTNSNVDTTFGSAPENEYSGIISANIGQKIKLNSKWYGPTDIGFELTSESFPITIYKTSDGFVPFTNGAPGSYYDSTGAWVNNPVIKTVSIKPSQRILFNYASTDKDKFLKSLSCTPDKSITVHQAYYSGGQVTDLVIKKDTTNLLIGGAPLTLASFPSHRALNTNEYLGYSQANGGNWVWTDFIPGSNGGPVGTDSNSLVTFTIDTRYCSYRVVSANTGLEITSGGLEVIPQVPDDAIYNNNQNPWGPGDITDDYLLDRADYEDGIIGDIQYGFDTLFKFLKMPFELLYKFIMTLGEIIQYALGTVSGFTTALQGIYAILPAPIWFLVIMAISINVFKLIFGR